MSDTAVSPAAPPAGPGPALPAEPDPSPSKSPSKFLSKSLPKSLSKPPPDPVPGLDFRVEESTQTRRRVRAEIPAEVFEEALQVEFRQIRRKARLPGFRRGKAPKAVIEQRYLGEARDPACQKLLVAATREILLQLDLEPLARPRWTLRESERGRPLVADLEVSIWPPLGAMDFEGIEVTVAKREVAEAEIAETLEEIARRQARPGPVEGRGLRDADLVTGDLRETDLANDAPPRATDGLHLQIGTGAYHPALHEALQGAAVGDTVVATAHFGTDSPDRERAGKTVRVQFTVKEAATAVSPPIDDDLARSVGADSLLALRGDIRDRLRKEAARSDRRELEQKIMAAFLEKNPVEAPEPMVEAELEIRLRSLATTMARQGVEVENAEIDWPKHAAELRPLVENAVRAGIALDALAEQQEIEADEEQIEARLRPLAEAQQKTVAAVRASLEGAAMRQITTEVRRAQALRFLEERARIEPAP